MSQNKLIVHSLFNRFKISFFLGVVVLMLTAFAATSAQALPDTTQPTIVMVSPANNEDGVLTNEQINVVFSEDMDSSTVNKNTFTVMQRTTPASGGYKSIAVDGKVTYDSLSHTAIFAPNEAFSPDQHYGNVFTATITGVKDISGNSIARDYVWSFTTGNSPFNTGATTSQLNQSSTLVSQPVQPVLPVVVPPTPAPATGFLASINKYPWAWSLGALFVLLLFLLILSTFISRNKSVPRKDTVVVRPSPFGDSKPVIDLEGIGPDYNQRLHAMGIKNTQQLWEADAATVAHQTGASLSTVKSWQHMAELSSVKDIGPQYAELLERSGVHSIVQLKNSNVDKLLKLVRKKQNSLKVNIQGNSPGHATVEHWIYEARHHKFNNSGMAGA